MELTTYYRLKPSRPGAEPYCFSNVRGSFEDLEEAVWLAKFKARSAQMGAHSFLISTPEGQTYGPWEFEGDGTWRRLDAPAEAQDVVQSA